MARAGEGVDARGGVVAPCGLRADLPPPRPRVCERESELLSSIPLAVAENPDVLYVRSRARVQQEVSRKVACCSQSRKRKGQRE